MGAGHILRSSRNGTHVQGFIHGVDHALQGRSSRRQGIPAAGRVADRGGHTRARSGRHDGREPDAQPRRAQARHRAVHQDGQEARAGDRRRRLQLHGRGDRLSPATPRRRAPTRCCIRPATTTSRRRKASIATSRRSARRSTSRSSSTTCRCAPSSTSRSPTMARCAKLEHVIGVKDATANVGRVTQQRLACGKNFIQLSGEDGTVLGFMAHGGHGCISVTSNVAPRLCAAVPERLPQGRLEDGARAAGQADAAARCAVRRDQPGAR